MIYYTDKLDSSINTGCSTTAGMERNGYICLRSEIQPVTETDFVLDFLPSSVIPIYQPSDIPFKPKSDGERNSFGLNKFSKTIEVFLIANTSLTQQQIMQLKDEDWVAVLKQKDGQYLVFGSERGLRLKTSSQELNSTDTHGGILLTFDENFVNVPMYFGSEMVGSIIEGKPTITNVVPMSGAIGDTIVITGTNFIALESVKINGTGCTFIPNSETQITATIPEGATSGNVVVTTIKGTATKTGFVVTSVAPTITSFSPTSGAVGDIIIITGTNFMIGGVSVVDEVDFGDGVVADFTVDSSTQITAEIPEGSTSGDVIVITSIDSTYYSATKSGFVFVPAVTDKITGTLHDGDQVYLSIDADKTGAIKFANNTSVTTTAGLYGADGDKTCPATGAVEITMPTNNAICSLNSEFNLTQLRGAVTYNGDGVLDLYTNFVTSLTANECLNLNITDNTGDNFTSFAASKVKTLYIALNGTTQSTVLTSVAQTIHQAYLDNRASIAYVFSGVSDVEIEAAYDALYDNNYDAHIAVLTNSTGLNGSITFN